MTLPTVGLVLPNQSLEKCPTGFPADQAYEAIIFSAEVLSSQMILVSAKLTKTNQQASQHT